jgi:hypothetical protein
LKKDDSASEIQKHQRATMMEAGVEALKKKKKKKNLDTTEGKNVEIE